LLPINLSIAGVSYHHQFDFFFSLNRPIIPPANLCSFSIKNFFKIANVYFYLKVNIGPFIFLQMQVNQRSMQNLKIGLNFRLTFNV